MKTPEKVSEVELGLKGYMGSVLWSRASPAAGRAGPDANGREGPAVVV